ncbi:MAG: shikimate kinase [Candidatus Omnitrophica bacterium]|nr:shikimate kinase [Candidatus Omnitrophota bacterium]
MNIYLVGFMGTGKTAAAKKVARKFSMAFVEMDEVIEKKENKTINEIFKEKGEAYFRKVEKGVVLEVSGGNNQVVSCGGGVVLDEENISRLKSSGIVICLNASPEVIYERVRRQTHRPLLRVENPEGRIRELLALRRPFYQKADFSINTSSLSIEEAAEKIVSLTKNKVSTGG